MIKLQTAIAAATLLATLPTVRADDTVRLLAGTGSLKNSASASTMNFKGADAETQAICCWRRAWRSGYCGPICPPVVYSAPEYYPPTHYAPPAAVLPSPTAYYYPLVPAASEVIGVAPTPYASARPSIVVGYQGRFFGGSIAIRPGARLTGLGRPPADPAEMAPAPRHNDTFRYDGGPSRPVPMPVPDPVSPTEPVPMTVPALHRVQIQWSRPNVSYPAYGEKPGKRAAVIDPLLVKRIGN